MKEKTKVVSKNSFYTVIALTTIQAGETILHIEGTFTDHPSKYSIQISKNKHLLPYSSDPDDPLSHWRFLNHSCDPNSFVDLIKMDVVALRTINKEEEVRFNYNLTEYDLATPFVCNCGEKNCLGEIKGFRYLSEQQLAQLMRGTNNFPKEIKM